jgi:glutamate dehydrogenase
VQIDKIKDAFEEALKNIWQGKMDSDGLNQLVLGARMPWQEIVILRAYVKYLRQAQVPFSTRFIENTLAKYSTIANFLIELFKIWHDPENQGQPETQAAGCAVAIDHEMEKVLSLDEDRLLRNINSIIDATLRTNFFQKDKEGKEKPYLSLKLDSRAINDLPEPRPFREIFVYSTRMEGIHLRGDKIARGGIRWSDRHEDFRTEILGLMKAQQVKNSVIVPMGAKGGFIVKNPPTEGGRDAYLQEGIECYKYLIKGLLDVTDNRRGTRILSPQNTICKDEKDPYLVVAADKGTATFSDIANELSQKYKFWLDDAFASGGSAGYDHKAMGITARGAWESVKRHFHELGHDTQKQPFEVIGVGDMAGDVFGNGMLQSEHIKLVGAFNHMHIFCDPNPNPATSYKERARLFENVKGWGDYNVKKLSKGGKIYSRSEKSLKLTKEIREKFGIKSERVTPAELIQAMLKTRTDLLWFGGIGTYIKSSSEEHERVGDKTNDPLRVNARDVQAKVIGEGANLAITQKGRIEYAKSGGRLNADYIDNSGGVDASDHEVNIKIMLAHAIRRKEHGLTLDKRNRLLESMTEEVSSLVLRNNYQQAQAISLMMLNAPQNLNAHSRLIKYLEVNHGLNRKLESLPDEEEIDELRHTGKGLCRPEISLLQSYSKILLSNKLLESDVPELPEMKERLFNYFPKPLRKKYEKEILKHRLRREIIATTLASSIVNRMGLTFMHELMELAGVEYADIARAYIIVRESFSLNNLWGKIESLNGSVPSEIQLKALRDVTRMSEKETRWFLTGLGRDLDMATDIKKYKDGVDKLKKNLLSVVTENTANSIRAEADKNIQNGLPKSLAEELAIIPVMGAACDIIKTSIDLKEDLLLTARIYFELGEYFQINTLRQHAENMKVDDRWSSEVLQSVIDQLDSNQAGIVCRILNDMKKHINESNKDGKEIIESWSKKHSAHLHRLDPIIADIKKAGEIDLPMLIIAEQRLRKLYGG